MSPRPYAEQDVARLRLELGAAHQEAAELRAALGAARESIAREIDAVPQVPHESVSWMDGWDDGMEHAARIVRGTA